MAFIWNSSVLYAYMGSAMQRHIFSGYYTSEYLKLTHTKKMKKNKENGVNLKQSRKRGIFAFRRLSSSSLTASCISRLHSPAILIFSCWIRWKFWILNSFEQQSSPNSRVFGWFWIGCESHTITLWGWYIYRVWGLIHISCLSLDFYWRFDIHSVAYESRYQLTVWCLFHRVCG